MAKILRGPQGLFEVAEWLGGGRYSVMAALRGTGMADAQLLMLRASTEDAFRQRLSRIAGIAAKELECAEEDVEFVVTYLGGED
jgi:hypothetical protein